MMTKLSKREKVLLYILACLVIFAGSLTLLIMPALEKRSELQDTLGSIDLQRQQMEVKRESYTALTTRLNALLEEDEAIAGTLFDSADPPEMLDIFVIEIARSCGVTPTTLEIGTPDYRVLDAYGSQTEEEVSAETDDSSQPGTILIEYTVSGTCTYDQFIAMMDAYSQRSQMLIGHASYTQGLDASSPNLFTITLQFYLPGAFDRSATDVVSQ